MAHRTNVIQVTQTIEPSDLPETVRDPVCGKEIQRKESRHMLAKTDSTLYFCSKACQNRYVLKKMEYLDLDSQSLKAS